jgi:hypothetical protein
MVDTAVSPSNTASAIFFIFSTPFSEANYLMMIRASGMPRNGFSISSANARKTTILDAQQKKPSRKMTHSISMELLAAVEIATKNLKYLN